LIRQGRQGRALPFVVTYDEMMVGAVAMACDHCFAALGLHRIEIAIRPENVASLRVVEKLGFSRIGLARRYLHINGMWRDHELFALTVEDVPSGVLNRLTRQGSANA
jgi:ribosomal-protein-alanine N-acetyltransferase